jgi:16S rRNA (guanine1516-N2)-methyltransferase
MDRLGAVVMTFPFWVQADYVQQAATWQQQFEQLNIDTVIHPVEKISARHLRQHPDLAFTLDDSGLSLAANGMKMQPDWVGQLHRLKRATHKSELMARACNTTQKPRLLDATAGLGHDALLMAWLGATVVMIERHPVLYALLSASLAQARLHPEFQDALSRVTLVHAEAREYLAQLSACEFDVIYLDPMFPKSDQADKKQPQVKKEMQILHLLLPQHGAMDLGEYLLPAAQAIAPRVIVKRPKLAPPLSHELPQHQWVGDACRFDGYFQPSLIASTTIAAMDT